MTAHIPKPMKMPEHMRIFQDAGNYLESMCEHYKLLARVPGVSSAEHIKLIIWYTAGWNVLHTHLYKNFFN